MKKIICKVFGHKWESKVVRKERGKYQGTSCEIIITDLTCKTCKQEVKDVLNWSIDLRGSK